ncbi:MAG TPA: glycosyltransferase family A protein [Acidimicrobiales bacterium]|nr:glycosyltransferase family A protein [Acidimicrobiales bacterium]
MPDADDARLLDAFVTYLRRQLGPEGPAVAHVALGESISRAPRDAGMVVVAGDRSPVRERLWAARARMTRQWHASAHAAPGSAGVPFSVWDRWAIGSVGATPDGFDVLAIVTTRNEADIVGQMLDRLLAGGVRVHVIDNWSTDDTPGIVGAYFSGGRVTTERFPAEGPSPYFDLQSLLRRVGEVAHASGADWVVHHDADEIHEAAWPGVSLRDGLWAVERWGFNCVDHAAIDFRPIADTWKPGDDLASSFDWFEFGSAPGHFLLLKAWKPQPTLVSNAESGGHSIDFPGRQVFPYKFPIRHYPLRSADHARRKLFVERMPRWNPKERAKGMHVHYDEFTEASPFIWDPETLHRWSTVDDGLLLQRISGVGLPNNPWPGEG